MSHADRSYYTRPTVITQSRGYSSSGSSSIRSSTDTHNSSSWATMGSGRTGDEKLRVPDNKDRYISARTTGSVKVVNHSSKAYDENAPLASSATSEHFDRERRERREREQRQRQREEQQRRAR